MNRAHALIATSDALTGAGMALRACAPGLLLGILLLGLIPPSSA